VADAGQIYVDLDDVIAQTIRALVALLERHFARRVEIEDVVHFDLGRSFGLAPDELVEFMRLVHQPQVLAALEPNPGATPALASWIERGYAVAVMTGRPPSAAPASRRWLREHRIPHTSFACIDKYDREDWAGPAGRALGLDEVADLGFALAVEDSLEVAALLVERCGIPVALMDRPWNRDLSGLAPLTRARIVRCHGWAELASRFPNP
jgi:uncharacterized HAD superfamily protein